jgi:chromosome segregation ATPase
MEVRLEALAQDVATRDAHLAELETAVTSAQEQKRRMEVRLEALAQDVATRDAQLAEEKAAGRQQVADTAARLEQSIAQTEALQIELVEKTKDIRLLRHQMLERQSAEAESQKQLRNQFDQKSQELRQQLASTERRLKEAEATASRHLEQLLRNNAAVDGANARIRALESTLTEQQAILSDQTTTIRLLRHEVHTLRSSTSWKVSKPLRIVKVVLTHPRRVLNRLLGLNNQSSRSE